MNVPINYQEQQRQVQIYDYLVFVNGVEISNYSKSIEVSHTNRTAPGSATITLANPYDQWIMTVANLKGAYRLANDRFSERPKWLMYNKKKAYSANLVISRTGGAANPANFGGSVSPPAENITAETDQSLVATKAEDFLERYSFGPGTCIFSKMDTVKVYIRDPYSDPDTTDQWIPFFTGTVDTKPLVTNFISGESTVTLNCFDIRHSMQGMRISINPYKNILPVLNPGSSGGGIQTSGTTNANIIRFSSDSVGFFKDYYPSVNDTSAPSFTNIFAGKTFVDAVSMIITGKTQWVKEGGDGLEEGPGVGYFENGTVYRYANPNQSMQSGGAQAIHTDLSGWDNLCLFGDVGDFWTYQQCMTEGQDSFWDGASHPFTGSLHWLVPGEGLAVSSLIQEVVGGVSDIAGSPDWTDRYSLLMQMATQVDYEFTVTGAGDIVFEFPMYDFKPENFSQHPGVYSTEMHVKSENISDEGGEVVAGLECVSVSSQLGNTEKQQQLNATDRQLNVSDWRVLVFSNVLAAKYGAKIQSVSFTGVRDQAGMNKLALVEFQKRLAEANKLSLDMVFRPYLRPNRPFQYAERNRARLGKINTVGFNMPVFQEPSMSLSLGCVRLPLYNVTTGVTSFQHITSAEAMALSYNEILEPPSDILNGVTGNGDRGISIQTPTTPTSDGVSSTGTQGN